MRQIPLALVILRLCLAPVLLATALLHPDRVVFAICLLGALLSDYFDGVVARRLGVATTGLRRLDSITDSIFYACALLAALVTAYELVRPYFPALVALLLIEALRYVYDIRKFGKEASYHMWSSKLWGLLLFIGMWSLLVRQHGGWPVALAILWGIAADLEGLVISMTLRKWQADVPTVWHARRLAKADS
ncbi:MAG TPA: CDP-alcohol phosphatidyltransferase family protein [Rhodanobacteraceae bacterium]|nr:CDP-alcohol phosphatidyltransferase family protein [Rhodanobacteraceae bacterium]